MASTYLTGTNATFDNTGNWSLAAAPADTNDIYCDRGETNLTTNLDQTGGDLDPASISLIGTYTGSIGDESTNSLKVDDISGFIEIDLKGNPNQIINLWPDTVPTVRIHNTGSHPYACYLRAGTISGNLEIYGGQSIRLGASLVVSGNLIVKPVPGQPLPQITIMEGCTLSGAIDMQGGVVKCSAAVAASTFKLSGSAVWWHIGESTGNITNTLEARGAARVYLMGAGFTVGAVNTFDDALVTAIAQGGYRSGPYTYTNSTAYGGIFLNKRNDTFSNAPVQRGGQIPNYGSKTIGAMALGA